MLNVKKLPCKSTINNYALSKFTLTFLSKFNERLVDAWVKKPIDMLLDASGIQVIGKSVWYCIRTKKKTLKRDCDKIHIAVSLCSLLIVSFRISKGRRNDSPFLRMMLKPFQTLGAQLLLTKATVTKRTQSLQQKELVHSSVLLRRMPIQRD